MQVFDVVVVQVDENGNAVDIVFDERLLAKTKQTASAMALVEAADNAASDGSDLEVLVRPFV